MRKINEELRKKLKKPIGKLYKCIPRFGKGKIIAVGDIASYELIRGGVMPDLMIYDKKVKRRPVAKKIKKSLDAVKCNTFYIKNPRGTVSEEAWIVIGEGLKRRSKIVVAGEEDLLVLPAAMLAKKGDSVLYGQPNKGVVLIKVNEKKKNAIKRLIDAMEVVV